MGPHTQANARPAPSAPVPNKQTAKRFCCFYKTLLLLLQNVSATFTAADAEPLIIAFAGRNNFCGAQQLACFRRKTAKLHASTYPPQHARAPAPLPRGAYRTPVAAVCALARLRRHVPLHISTHTHKRTHEHAPLCRGAYRSVVAVVGALARLRRHVRLSMILVREHVKALRGRRAERAQPLVRRRILVPNLVQHDRAYNLRERGVAAAELVGGRAATVAVAQAGMWLVAVGQGGGYWPKPIAGGGGVGGCCCCCFGDIPC
eukprot:365686-Chlamydomonas_euryale.AAC.5